MNNKMLERWKLKTKGIFHKIVYDEFWFYIDDLMKENKKLTNNWRELEEFIIEQEEINNGAMKCGLSSDSEIDEMGIQNDIYDLILDKMKEIKENHHDPN